MRSPNCHWNRAVTAQTNILVKAKR